jgi:hypothetical protein
VSFQSDIKKVRSKATTHLVRPALVRFDVHSWHDLIEMLSQEFPRNETGNQVWARA